MTLQSGKKSKKGVLLNHVKLANGKRTENLSKTKKHLHGMLQRWWAIGGSTANTGAVHHRFASLRMPVTSLKVKKDKGKRDTTSEFLTCSKRIGRPWGKTVGGKTKS